MEWLISVTSSDGRTHAFLWGRHGTVCGSESWLDGPSRSVAIMGRRIRSRVVNLAW